MKRVWRQTTVSARTLVVYILSAQIASAVLTSCLYVLGFGERQLLFEQTADVVPFWFQLSWDTSVTTLPLESGLLAGTGLLTLWLWGYYKLSLRWFTADRQPPEVTILTLSRPSGITRGRIWCGLGIALLVSTGVLGSAAAGAGAVSASGDSPGDGITVVTSQGLGFKASNINQSGGLPGGILAVKDGEVVYKNTTYHDYWDVDPVEGTKSTVLYSASEYLEESSCPDNESCFRMHVQTVNLTTGEVTPLYSEIVHKGDSKRWHDVDRINETHIVVADMERDGVFIANTQTDEVTWSWWFNQSYEMSTSGRDVSPKKKAADWTHVNDVEVLADGRLMLSPRNFNRLLFVKPGKGLLKNQTIGTQERPDIMHGQHNPDFINSSNGGTAVLIADSLNNRIVEYQKTDSGWEQSWVWADKQLKWPRDADRLPNGHTLITDTNGNRIVEVDEKGKTVWSLSIKRPYEAERLGTGDESAGGQSAAALGLRSQKAGGERMIRSGSPLDVASSAIWFAAPLWMGTLELVAAVVVGFVFLVLGLDVFWLVAGRRVYRWCRRRLGTSETVVARSAD